MGKGPSTFTVVRDSVLLVAGIAGIAFQQITGSVNVLLLGAYMTMLGIPGLSSGLWLLKQIGDQQRSSSPEPRSRSRRPPSSNKS